MDQLALLLVLLLGAVVTVPLGDRLGLPAPVLMTLLGVVLALLPFVPDVDIPPEFILPLVLPPLLYATVQRTSWRQFAANRRPILLLAVALVLVTTAAVGAVAHTVVPGLPIAAAVALGALVAPPDPVAATAVAGSLGLPRRLVSILEGEGLFNDVTAIVVYHVAVGAVVAGAFSWGGAAVALLLSAVVAVAVGFALGRLGGRLMDALGDATLRTGLTLLLPFAAYAVSEELHGSGVLAVLVTALTLSAYTVDADDVLGRLTGRSFWEVVDTLVTGVAFGLVGLELSTVLDSAEGPAAGHARLGRGGRRHRRRGPAAVAAARHLAGQAAALAARHRRGDPHDVAGGRRHVVVRHAGRRDRRLALALPYRTDAGEPFPGRDEIVFVAFCVIMATLVVQGLTLPWLVGRLGVRADTGAERRLERELAVRAAHAAKRRLRQIEAEEGLPEELVERLRGTAYDIGALVSPDAGDAGRQAGHGGRRERIGLVLRIRRELMSAARREVLAARTEPGADPEVVDRVLHRLDVRSLR